MKKILLFSILLLSIISCSSDESDTKDFTVEFLSNTPNSAVYISGINIKGKYIKNYHKEKVTLGKIDYSFYARCDDEKTLISIKLYNSRGKLIDEESGNKSIAIVGKSF
jgi:hypothetical protein